MKYSLLVSAFLISIGSHAQTWTPKGPPTTGLVKSSMVAVTLNGTGYMGLGDNSGGGNNFDDFWKYNPGNDTWTQLANYSGAPRKGCASFGIGNYIYVGLGWNNSAFFTDFFRYDVVNNVWSTIASFPGGQRIYPISVSDGTTFGYVGFGSHNSTFYNDLWQYIPSADTWLVRASCSTVGRNRMFDFFLNGKIYTGLGYTGTGTMNDVWEYNPVFDTWTQKNNFPGASRYSPVSIYTALYGYCGLGATHDNSTYYMDFWQYNPNTDTWAALANYPTATGRVDAVGFNLNSILYVGTGYYNGTYYNDFWALETNDGSGINEAYNNPSVSIYPNPARDQAMLHSEIYLHDARLEVYDLQGKLVHSRSGLSGQSFTIDRSKLPAGEYVLKLYEGSSLLSVNKLMLE